MHATDGLAYSVKVVSYKRKVFLKQNSTSNQYLVRLEHLFEEGEHPELVKRLKNIFFVA
jgi:hypothetical protein